MHEGATRVREDKEHLQTIEGLFTRSVCVCACELQNHPIGCRQCTTVRELIIIRQREWKWRQVTKHQWFSDENEKQVREWVTVEKQRPQWVTAMMQMWDGDALWPIFSFTTMTTMNNVNNNVSHSFTVLFSSWQQNCGWRQPCFRFYSTFPPSWQPVYIVFGNWGRGLFEWQVCILYIDLSFKTTELKPHLSLFTSFFYLIHSYSEFTFQFCKKNPTAWS